MAFGDKYESRLSTPVAPDLSGSVRAEQARTASTQGILDAGHDFIQKGMKADEAILSSTGTNQMQELYSLYSNKPDLSGSDLESFNSKLQASLEGTLNATPALAKVSVRMNLEAQARDFQSKIKSDIYKNSIKMGLDNIKTSIAQASNTLYSQVQEGNLDGAKRSLSGLQSLMEAGRSYGMTSQESRTLGIEIGGTALASEVIGKLNQATTSEQINAITLSFLKQPFDASNPDGKAIKDKADDLVYSHRTRLNALQEKAGEINAVYENIAQGRTLDNRNVKTSSLNEAYNQINTLKGQQSNIDGRDLSLIEKAQTVKLINAPVPEFNHQLTNYLDAGNEQQVVEAVRAINAVGLSDGSLIDLPANTRALYQQVRNMVDLGRSEEDIKDTIYNFRQKINNFSNAELQSKQKAYKDFQTSAKALSVKKSTFKSHFGAEPEKSAQAFNQFLELDESYYVNTPSDSDNASRMALENISEIFGTDPLFPQESALKFPPSKVVMWSDSTQILSNQLLEKVLEVSSFNSELVKLDPSAPNYETAKDYYLDILKDGVSEEDRLYRRYSGYDVGPQGVATPKDVQVKYKGKVYSVKLTPHAAVENNNLKTPVYNLYLEDQDNGSLIPMQDRRNPNNQAIIVFKQPQQYTPELAKKVEIENQNQSINDKLDFEFGHSNAGFFSHPLYGDPADTYFSRKSAYVANIENEERAKEELGFKPKKTSSKPVFDLEFYSNAPGQSLENNLVVPQGDLEEPFINPDRKS